MPKTFCGPSCNELVDRGTHCPACQAALDTARKTQQRAYDRTRNRPSTSERGYGADYQRRRKQLLTTATSCWWCPEPFTEADPVTIDHVVPLHLGGSNDPSNLVPAHRSCNSRRGSQLRRRQA
jgi:5-methylcytosine-specific restriction protein A